MSEIVVQHLTKRFGSVTALQDASLTIGDGEFIVLLGPTGAGKTTMLRLVAGLDRPDEGRILINGADVTRAPPAARDITFVFQQYSLYPHLTVYENLAFPLRSPVRKMPEAEIRRVVQNVAELLRIADKLQNRATQLSGGQMQRVAIGRALVRRPAIALMDEPLSSLDAKLRADLRIELKRIQQDLGETLLYVTHDQTEAMTLATRIGVLRDGHLVQVGTPREIYENPADVYVAGRLGHPPINLLPRRLFPDFPAPGAAATVGVRTEHLQIAKVNGHKGAGPAGRVTWIEHLGDQNNIHVAIEDQETVSLVDPDTPLAVGDLVSVSLHRPLFFDRAGARVQA
ncbi:ABC transporter ATP-binding protein [Oleomonas cavernae]|uniref:ABC transporter ATP-binding protein n=1 Tax=Oleomonas cavernae TaxID=2320859 RepID=A0A418WIL8_9PROT|nr:ABC transporter ATP-binding protein [Oleomonas cavernae]RJF89891.1 ABC transporter ATP-binding protein [Oleomonas cavernae]